MQILNEYKKYCLVFQDDVLKSLDDQKNAVLFNINNMPELGSVSKQVEAFLERIKSEVEPQTMFFEDFYINLLLKKFGRRYEPFDKNQQPEVLNKLSEMQVELSKNFVEVVNKKIKDIENELNPTPLSP